MTNFAPRLPAGFAAAVLLFACGGGPPITIAEPRVFDVGPELPLPAFALAVVFESSAAEHVALPRAVTLTVRSTRTGGHLDIKATLFDAPEEPIPLAPGERLEVVYDLWRLANVFRSGRLRELRSAPETMRFRVRAETELGVVETSEWGGVVADAVAARALLGMGETEL